MNHDSPAPPAARRISGWRRFALWPVGAIAKFWWWSLRLEISPEERRLFESHAETYAFVLWHNRLFLVPAFYRRYRGGRPVYGLVSPSEDGAWLVAFFDIAGLKAVRGSSSEMAREGAMALVRTLKAGNDIGITPDGPRGPCYDFKPGALIVSRQTGTSLLLLGGRFEKAWRLKSWDGFYLPKPFSRVHVRCERISAEQLADRDEAAGRIAARLRELNPD